MIMLLLLLLLLLIYCVVAVAAAVVVVVLCVVVVVGRSCWLYCHFFGYCASLDRYNDRSNGESDWQDSSCRIY